jgi:polyhydroxyalkanoate synthesis regulator phasin
MNRLIQSIEEGTEKVLGGLSIPGREDLDSLAVQLRGGLEEQIRKVIGRLNLATREEVEAVAGDLAKLKRQVAGLKKAAGSNGAKAAPKKKATTKK